MLIRHRILSAKKILINNVIDGGARYYKSENASTVSATAAYTVASDVKASFMIGSGSIGTSVTIVKGNKDASTDYITLPVATRCVWKSLSPTQDSDYYYVKGSTSFTSVV